MYRANLLNGCILFLKEEFLTMGDFWKVLLGGLISGCFSFAVAWFVFRTENEKVTIKHRHEIALNHLIPNLYTPLLKILEVYKIKDQSGKFNQIDFVEIADIIERNVCWLLFVPKDIQVSLKGMRDLCIDVQKQERDKLMIMCLEDLNKKLKQNFAKYVLRG
jgi:hypothetical protein